MTTVGPTYTLRPWEILRNFSKHLSILTAPKSTYGLTIGLILAFSYLCFPGYALVLRGPGGVIINLDTIFKSQYVTRNRNCNPFSYSTAPSFNLLDSLF